MFNVAMESTTSRPSTHPQLSPAVKWARGRHQCREAQAGDTCRLCHCRGWERLSLSWLQAGQTNTGKREGVAELGPTVAFPSSRSQVNTVSLQNKPLHSQNPPSDHTFPLPSHNQPAANPNTQQCQNKLINLVGRRCMVQCHLDNVPTKARWDSGAQASLMNDHW